MSFQQSGNGLRSTGYVGRQSGQGQKRATTNSRDRYLTTMAKRNKQLMSAQITKNSTVQT